MIRKTKEELLEHYATGEVHKFTQFDGFLDVDSIMRPDEDGDCLSSGETNELRHSGKDLAVRVYIHEGTESKDAVRLLEKILNWVIIFGKVK